MSQLTTQELQIWTVCITAANALVSAGVAIFTVWLAQERTDTRESRKDATAAENRKREFLREKLEELVTAALEHYEELWERAGNLCSSGLAMADGRPPTKFQGEWTLSPKARLDMLQGMYFPALFEPCRKLGDAGLAVHKWLAAEGQVIAADPKKWHAEKFSSYQQRQGEQLMPVRERLNALLTAAKGDLVLLMPA